MNKIQQLENGAKGTYHDYQIVFVKIFGDTPHIGNCLVVYIRNHEHETAWVADNSTNIVITEPITEPIKNRTIKDGLQHGDIIENTINRLHILATVDEIVFVSNKTNPYVYGTTYSLYYLLKMGYEIVNKSTESIETVKEMTIAEISKAIGQTVKVIE